MRRLWGGRKEEAVGKRFFGRHTAAYDGKTCALVVGTGGLADLNSAGNFGREKREMQKVSVNFPFSDTVFNAGAVY